MKYTIATLASLLLFAQLVVPTYGDDSLFGRESPFGHGFVEIKLLDAYFGTSASKIEVEPGDKNVPLTVVFSNIGSQDIAGIRGQLNLPTGFSSSKSSQGLIEADNIQVAQSGQSFALTFFVDLDKNLPMQQYQGTIKLTFSRVRESGSREHFDTFTFKLPGKGVLNVKAQNPFLIPSTNNEVTVEISNPGTAPISNIDVVLQNTQTSIAANSQSTTNLEKVVFDQNHWKVGTVLANSKSFFSFNIYVPQDLADNAIHAPVSVSYFDAQGNQVTQTRTIDFIVGPANPGSALKISTTPYLTTGIMENLALELTNLSGSKISDISISVTPHSDAVKILQDTKWFIKEIDPLSKTKLEIPVFADRSVQERAIILDISVQYTNKGNTVAEKHSVGLYMKGLIDTSIFGINVIEIAGKQTIIGNVLNQGNTKGLFATATVEPLADSNIKKSTQYIGDIDTDAPVPFNIPIEFVGEPRGGEHKVRISVSYKDSLLQDLVVTQETSIFYKDGNTKTTYDLSQISIIILVIVAGGIGGILLKMGKIKTTAIRKIKEGSS